MEYTKLGPVEGRFADLIWENAPMTTAQLVALAGDALDWKRTTTYTVLKRLCDRGLFLLENGTVTAQLSRAVMPPPPRVSSWALRVTVSGAGFTVTTQVANL